MREPKRLAHRQAERNKARALKRWNLQEGDEEWAAPAVAPVDGVADGLPIDSPATEPQQQGAWLPPSSEC